MLMSNEYLQSLEIKAACQEKTQKEAELQKLEI